MDFNSWRFERAGKYILGCSLAGIYQLERLLKQSLRSNILTTNLSAALVMMSVFKNTEPDLQAVLLQII